jgi:hypothetical protein
MKRLYIIVEGQTEQEFVNSMIAPYLKQYGIETVVPIVIKTSISGRGGLSKYSHIKKHADNLLGSKKTDFIVSMFVDYFRIPRNLPNKEKWEHVENHLEQILMMEKCIAEDINDNRFIPYIQMHEFEALLFSSNKGFDYYFTKKESAQTKKIIDAYNNPEDINTTPEGAPSKRILAIKDNYDKVLEGNLVALEIGIGDIISKCPRFRAWIEKLIEACK